MVQSGEKLPANQGWVYVLVKKIGYYYSEDFEYQLSWGDK